MEKPMKRNIRLIFVLLLFLPSLACGTFTPKSSIVGSGNIETQTIDVSGFDRVLLKGFGEVYIEQGPRESLSVQTDANIIPLLDKIGRASCRERV